MTTKVWGDSSPESVLILRGLAKADESDLYVPDLISRGTGNWNMTKKQVILPELAEEILALRPILTGASDSYIWYHVASGAYSAKSGYAADFASAIENSPQSKHVITTGWQKSVWNVKCLPKIKLLIWKILHEAIPTGSNLERRGGTKKYHLCSLWRDRDNKSFVSILHFCD
ncbi:hypothetical protein Rs2_21853 [Raphanus sativus]|nr:hypothetical protein Rs2_21853 [Raphanus sativus]